MWNLNTVTMKTNLHKASSEDEAPWDNTQKILDDGTYNPFHPDYKSEFKDHQVTFPSNNLSSQPEEKKDEDDNPIQRSVIYYCDDRIVKKQTLDPEWKQTKIPNR